jgi:hypothetical protein
MGFRRLIVTCAVALGAAGFCLAPGCSTTVIQMVNPGADAMASHGPDGTSSQGDAASTLDATVGTDSMAPGTIMPGADGQSTLGGVDAGCPGPDLRCHVDACVGHATSVSGRVYDPGGTNPIPHAFVFAPSDPGGQIPVITPGATSCDTCDVPIGSYVTATMTDEAGSFSLTGMPTGAHVPIVFQIGKWRREVFVSTTSCQDTALPASQTHLPASQAQGDMPAMALLTGGTDDLGCLLSRFGIDNQEFKAPHGGGRVDVYQGLGGAGLGGAAGNGPGLSNGTAGNCTNTSCPLWSAKASLEAYDIVLLACEGATFDGAPVDGGSGANVTAVGKQAMHDWLSEGGKVFATHFHYAWFANSPSPDFQAIAVWLGSSLGSAQGNYTIATSFPKAQDFATALADAGLLTSGEIALTSVGSSVSSVNAPALAWIKDPTNQNTKYFTFTTPVGRTCGKAAFSDLHAGGTPQGDIPAACTARALTAQERAMELLFFDLSACVSDDSMAPPGPPPSRN